MPKRATIHRSIGSKGSSGSAAARSGLVSPGRSVAKCPGTSIVGLARRSIATNIPVAGCAGHPRLPARSLLGSLQLGLGALIGSANLLGQRVGFLQSFHHAVAQRVAVGDQNCRLEMGNIRVDLTKTIPGETIEKFGLGESFAQSLPAIVVPSVRRAPQDRAEAGQVGNRLEQCAGAQSGTAGACQ